jgi:hypothetical protein
MLRTEKMPLLQRFVILRFPTVKQPIAGVNRPYRETQDDFIRERQSGPTGVSEQECPDDGNRGCIEAENVPPQPPRGRLVF